MRGFPKRDHLASSSKKFMASGILSLGSEVAVGNDDSHLNIGYSDGVPIFAPLPFSRSRVNSC